MEGKTMGKSQDYAQAQGAQAEVRDMRDLLANAVKGLEHSKAQLVRDLANAHNSHAGRMFMAQDSYRIIARYEARVASLRAALTGLTGYAM